MLSSRLSATGFFINQQSVKGQGRAGSGNAVAADELGTVFLNPAGLPKIVFDSSGNAEWRVSGGFNWSTFKEVRIRFEDGWPDAVRTAHYRHAYGLSVGADVPLQAFFADTSVDVTRTFFDNTLLASRVNVKSSVQTHVTTLGVRARVGRGARTARTAHC